MGKGGRLTALLGWRRRAWLREGPMKAGLVCLAASAALFLSWCNLLAETPLNPSGIVLGDTATYWVSIQPTNFPDSLIAWTSEPPDRVSFPQGNTGRVVTVQGEATGDVLLKPVVTGFPQFTPALQARVVTSSVVNVHAYIICSTNGHASTTQAAISTLLTGANDIWRQVGVSFQLASCHFVTNDLWLRVERSGGTWPMGSFIVDYASGTGGVECYFVDVIDQADGLTFSNGVIVANTGNFRTLAHEFGHTCNLRDIYVLSNRTSYVSVTGNVARVRLGAEWGSESDQGYYAPGTMQADVIQRLIMFGVRSDLKTDVPYGDIYGFWYSRRFDPLLNVVQKDWHLSPAPVGFFQHGTQHPFSL